MAATSHDPGRDLERLNEEIRELRRELQRERRHLPEDEDPFRLSVIATAAGVLALAAFTTFLVAALDTAMPLWLAALIVAAFYAPIALVLRATVRRTL